VLFRSSTGGTIDFSASSALKLACSNKSITVVSNGYIKTAANAVLQTTKTSGATLVLWADQDRAQNAGGIMTFGQGTFLNTSGGATTTSQGTTGAVGGGIWIAGGTSGTDGYPSGYALGNASGEIGIDLNSASGSATGFRVYTGGGNLVMRGESSTTLGIRGSDGVTLDSGAGSITMNGLSTTSSSGSPHPIEFNQVNSAYSATITSAKASGDAITITGTHTGTAADAIGFSSWSGTTTNGLNITATGATGNIVLTGTGGSNSDQGIRLNNANIYTVGGNITLDAGARGIAWNNQNAAYVDNIGAASGSSSTGTFTLRTDRLNGTAGTFNVRMAKVVVEPSSTNFSAAQTFPYAGWAISNATDLRLGKAAATGSDITLNAFTFPGNVEMYGRTLSTTGSNTITNNFDMYGTTIEIGGTQMVSGVGKRFMAKATSYVRAATGSTVRTYGGLLSLWGDSDASGGGAVVLKSAATTGSFLCTANTGLCGTATTGGGDIVIGGGAAETDTSLSDYTYRPGGFAAGSTTDNETGTASGGAAANSYSGGVYLGTAAINTGSTQLYSAGGNITVRGKTHTGTLTNWAAAVVTPGGLTVDAGAGKIFLDAYHVGAASSVGGPMEFNAWGGTT
jgi:hypothetical protein